MSQLPLAPHGNYVDSAVIFNDRPVKVESTVFEKFPGTIAVRGPCEVLLASLQDGPQYDRLIATLRRSNVTVHLCHGMRDIQQTLKSHDCSALLIDAISDDQDLAITEDDIGHLLSQNAYLRLIALIPSGAILAPQLQEFLRLGWLYDFHTAPLDVRRLLYCLGHLHGLVQMERKYATFQKATRAGYGRIIGTSPRMQKIYESIWRISKVDTPVLLTGESGTGKELIAHTLHDRSKYTAGRFVAVNCAALPPNLIASELFGHEQGAFTGAGRMKRGLVEEAHNGTLFLDEIGDMPLELQPHFLRFLQDGSFKRVGGTASLKIRMRLIAATNVDLKEAMRRGQFREDLYYRLNVLAIEVPPLRERENDIEILAEYFLQKFSLEYNRPKMRFSNKTIMALVQNNWSGNVRELMSAVSRAVVMTPGTLIKPEDLGLVAGRALSGGAADDGEPAPDMTLFEARDAFDRQFIAASIQSNQKNILRTARALGVSRVALYRLMKRHGLSKQDVSMSEQGGEM
ncbi:sigma-54 dependent transcriptional regulator [Govanella unica]|uniref:Sigma-54 dependent transcriptional regulator n=1 Tax=Govanella unica TaxID=2975056 RepID=A0A9X3U0B0_9PROT|nr:sigma-54 dependent transcriptional regulator [Govania unica]MDA5194737.1 sigma-54 dependent transcriptional regulator [Govania unica]